MRFKAIRLFKIKSLDSIQQDAEHPGYPGVADDSPAGREAACPGSNNHTGILDDRHSRLSCLHGFLLIDCSHG